MPERTPTPEQRARHQLREIRADLLNTIAGSAAWDKPGLVTADDHHGSLRFMAHRLGGMADCPASGCLGCRRLICVDSRCAVPPVSDERALRGTP
jgi:hypothetical protein